MAPRNLDLLQAAWAILMQAVQELHPRNTGESERAQDGESANATPDTYSTESVSLSVKWGWNSYTSGF